MEEFAVTTDNISDDLKNGCNGVKGKLTGSTRFLKFTDRLLATTDHTGLTFKKN